MLEKIKNEIDIALEKFVDDFFLSGVIAEASPVLYRGVREFVMRPGKRIRPVLFCLSINGYSTGKKPLLKDTVKCSLAFELLHDFLLVHDDVIDNSSLRRGKPTLHKVFNSKLKLSSDDRIGGDLAIVAGDIMAAMAFEALLSFRAEAERKDRAFLEFTRAMSITGLGEFIDIVNDITDIKDLKRKDVLNTYIYKTAKYTFEAPLVIGAVLGGAGPAEFRKLSILGRSLGQAFQLQDDLLDIFLSSKKTGKPALSDISESKKTLLVWKMFQMLRGKDREKALKIFLKKEKTSKEKEEFRDFIISSGAGDYCTGLADSLFVSSKDLMSQLKMSRHYSGVMLGLLENSFLKLKDFSNNCK